MAYPGKLSPAAREELRARAVAEIPRWYNPWAHLAFPSVLTLGLIAWSMMRITDLRAWQLLIIPFTILVSNAAEWRAHRDLLHRRQPPLDVLYLRHTPLHHRLFIREDMSIRSKREFHLVLIPAYGILIIFMAVLPIALLIDHHGQRNIAALFLATCMFYTVSYEWLHLSYHLPPDSFVGRRWLVRVLRRHHATHHTPELMQRWNFNVTLPLWDFLRGTIYHGPPIP